MKAMKRSSLAIAIAVATTGFGVLAVPSVALGQSLQLEEIVVTARKREENLQDVPVAITVFTGQSLKEAGISDARGLFENTPGLNFDTGFDGNAATPAIRGVVSTEIASYRQKVTTFLDGMPMLGQQGNVPFNAISQVEVLRGPQSAAFGRSTFGGAINYTTRDPSDVFEGEFSVEVGSDNRLNLEALLAGPISEKIGYLLSASSNTVDGESSWVTQEEGIELGGQDAKSVLAKMVFTPTDNASIELRYKWIDVDDQQTPRVFMNLDDPHLVVHPDSNAAACGGGIPQPSCAYVGTFNDIDTLFNYNYAATGIDEGYTRNQRDRIEAEGSLDLDNGGSIQVNGFVSDEDFSRLGDQNLANDAFGYEGNEGNIEENYAEIRYNSSGDSKFRYGVGVSVYDYVFYSNIYRSAAANAAERPDLRFSESATNTGFFFNTAYDFTDQLTASLEGRYQSDDLSGNNPQADGSIFEIGQETTAFLPRFSLTYTPSDDTTYYFQAAKGNNPAGVNVGAVAPEVVLASDAYPDLFDYNSIAFFEEEEIFSMEIGVKGKIGDRGTYAVNVYTLDWENYTQPFNLNFAPADFIDLDDDNVGDVGTAYAGLNFNAGRSFVDAGDVTGKGIELESRYLLTDKLEVGLVGAYTDITYDDNACSTAPNGTFGVAANATTAIGLECVSVAGNRIATQPKLSGSISLSYKDELSNGMEWFARWNTRYTGSQYVTEMNLAELDAYTISDFRIGLSRDAWRAELYATNLFDEDSPQGPSPFFDGRVLTPAGTPAPPPFATNIVYTERRGTAFGLRFSYNFGGN